MVLKKHVVFCSLLHILPWIFLLESHAQITGTITDEHDRPLSQVHISILKTDKGTQTDSLGTYSIQAHPGDILQFSHLGKKTEEVRVRRDISVIDLVMTNQRIELTEVEIKKKRTTHFKTHIAHRHCVNQLIINLMRYIVLYLY